MFQFLTRKACLTAVGVILGSEVLWKLFKTVRKRWRSENTEVNKVLFFPVNSIPAPHLSGDRTRTVSKVKNSFTELLEVISGCKKSLDMCLFLITLKDMASMAIKLMQDGVRVRLIVDHSNIGLAGCQVGKLREAGVRVVARRQGGLMHHKFAVADGKVVVTGSFNWTSQAIFSNNENVVISSKRELVEPFVTEFERLWEENMVEVVSSSGAW